jgi:hypothetical protein
MMLSFIFLCVIASCFSLVIAANNGAAKVQLRASSSSATKAQKKEIAQSVINSVFGKSRTSGHIFRQKSTKEIEEIALTAVDPYDPAFSGGWWVGFQSYYSTSCSDTATSYFTDIDVSFCYVFEATTNGSATVYKSYAGLFTSDCESYVIGFYTNKKCSGTPAMQSNTKQTDVKLNTCTENTEDFESSEIVTCTKGSTGNPYKADVVVQAVYGQSETCDGKISAESYVVANKCYPVEDVPGKSYKISKFTSDGSTIVELRTYLYPCDGCSCTYTQIPIRQTIGKCYIPINDDVDDDGDDDGDDDDDLPFTSVSGNFSSTFKVFYESYEVNSAIGDAVNVGLSLALVVAVSFGLLI